MEETHALVCYYGMLELLEGHDRFFLWRSLPESLVLGADGF